MNTFSSTIITLQLSLKSSLWLCTLNYFICQMCNYIKPFFPSSTFQRSDLPRFLRRFALPNLAIRLIRIGVNACERLRKYHEAVELILIVLSSDLLTSCSSRIVCFFIKRLLLDQGAHCGDPIACLKKIESLRPMLQGLHPRHRLEIQTQIGRLTGGKSGNELSHFWRDTNGGSRNSKRGGNPSRKKEFMDGVGLGDMETLKKELLPRLKCAPVVSPSSWWDSRPHHFYVPLVPSSVACSTYKLTY